MLNEEQRDAIQKILGREKKIAVAYLFSPFARSREHEESDVDIGLVLTEGEEYTIREIARLSLIIEKEIGRDIDLHVLNGRDPRFIYEVLTDAHHVYIADERIREDFEARSLVAYLDFKQFLREHDKNVKRRITA